MTAEETHQTSEPPSAPETPNTPPILVDPQRARVVARQIATTLREKSLPNVFRIVLYCGEEQAWAWLDKTQEIEAQGGMMTRNGKRRRTAGGVYFQVAKHHLYHHNKALFRFVFRPNLNQQVGKKKRPTATAPTTPAPQIGWPQRGKLIEQARTQIPRGRATTVKVTLIGKLGKTIEKPQFTLAMMSNVPRLDTMPKGLPIPDKVPATQYIIYIGAKQWRKVREAVTNPDDMVIIEGTQFWDQEYESIAVFASNITTKLTQQALRESHEA